MKKILTILGARPQFVKAAVFSRLVNKYNHFEEIIVHTGQHYDNNMSRIFFDEMHIPKPKYNLNVNCLHHGAMTGQMLIGIDEIIEIEQPDFVLVYGDTNSTLAGALAAAKSSSTLIHVEGGLRSYNWQMPEEINRVITDALADIIFCPTQTAVDNLEKEGLLVQDKNIMISGDIMKDAVQYYQPIALKSAKVLERINHASKPMLLATIHRQENTDNELALKGIFQALNELNDNYNVILPLHPRTKNRMEAYHIQTDIQLLAPLGYFDMLSLLQKAVLVVTDSGGLQKEAYFNHKPCIILREQTEWVELVDEGFAKLCGADSDEIKAAVKHYMYQDLDFSQNIFGENVGEKIYQALYNLIK